jgi:glycosyltransferase involved in cell wall biosynthesis
VDADAITSPALGLRVLVVSDYGYPAGGVESFVREFLRFAASSFQCSILSWGENLLVPDEFHSVQSIEFGDVRAAWRSMDAADVLFVQTSFNVRMLARLAGEYLAVTGKPGLTVLHTSGHSRPEVPSIPTQERWLRELLSASTQVVAVSADVADAVQVLVGTGFTPAVIESASRFSIAARHRGSAHRTVSFIGRPFPEKGYDLFVRLANDLRQTGIEFLANTVSVPVIDATSSIAYSALLDDAALVSFFEATDVLVAPYLRSDGLPLALLEAISCSVPVIGFDSPGIGSLLRRYGQIVIEPNYRTLLDTVTAWHEGNIQVSVPSGESVSSWSAAFTRYSNILMSMGERSRASLPGSSYAYA